MAYKLLMVKGAVPKSAVHVCRAQSSISIVREYVFYVFLKIQKT